jgi:sec-independent protein translocase protein TatA
MAPLAMLGYQDIMLLLLVAVLLFGIKKLPELGRSLGRGIVEFKKGMKGLEDDIESSGTRSETAEAPRPPQRIGSATPKFDDRPVEKESQQKPV